MKILLEKLQKLNELERETSIAESAYENEPENVVLEKAFDDAYKKEFDAYISAARYIESVTNGKIDFLAAKKMIQTKRAELLQLLAL